MRMEAVAEGSVTGDHLSLHVGEVCMAFISAPGWRLIFSVVSGPQSSHLSPDEELAYTRGCRREERKQLDARNILSTA